MIIAASLGWGFGLARWVGVITIRSTGMGLLGGRVMTGGLFLGWFECGLMMRR